MPVEGAEDLVEFHGDFFSPAISDISVFSCGLVLGKRCCLIVLTVSDSSNDWRLVALPLPSVFAYNADGQSEDKFVPKMELNSIRAFRFPVGVDICLFFEGGKYRITAHVGSLFAEEFADFYFKSSYHTCYKCSCRSGFERAQITKYFAPIFWNLWKSKEYQLPEDKEFCYMFSANQFEGILILTGK